MREITAEEKAKLDKIPAAARDGAMVVIGATTFMCFGGDWMIFNEPRPRAYSKGDESEKKRELWVRHFWGDKYGGDWPGEGAKEFIAWFEEKIAEIPEAFRSSAKIEINSETSYDSHVAEIQITYYRPETDEEVSERRAGYAAQREREAAETRATYEALKRRFGD